jgi:hypothetical protein
MEMPAAAIGAETSWRWAPESSRRVGEIREWRWWRRTGRVRTWRRDLDDLPLVCGHLYRFPACVCSRLQPFTTVSLRHSCKIQGRILAKDGELDLVCGEGEEGALRTEDLAEDGADEGGDAGPGDADEVEGDVEDFEYVVGHFGTAARD